MKEEKCYQEGYLEGEVALRGMELLGGNVVTMAEMRRLFGAGVLDLAGYAVLVVVVIVIAALCMLTSRFGVYRILDTQK